MGSFKGKCEANLEVPERVGGGAGGGIKPKKEKNNILFGERAKFVNLILLI